MAAFDQQHPTSIQDFHSPEGGRKAMMTMRCTTRQDLAEIVELVA
jgi:hypothetical protein